MIKSDEPGAEQLRQAISRKENYCVLVPGHPHAIRLMHSMTFDLVIIDLDSREIMVEEVSEFLRFKNLRIPIIAYSSQLNRANAQEMLSAGIDAFLSSPKDENEICEAISQWFKAS